MFEFLFYHNLFFKHFRLLYFNFLGTQTDPASMPHIKKLKRTVMKQKKEIFLLKHQLRKYKKKIHSLKANLTQTKKKVMDYCNIEDNNALNFFTGLPNNHIFEWLLKLVKEDIKQAKKTFSLENHLLLVLMKLRHGYTNKDLSFRFNINLSVVSLILRQWLPVLSQKMKNLIVWPNREALRAKINIYVQ